VAGPRAAAGLALAGAAFALAVALVSQYAFGLAPCEMCHWQRWPYFAALPLALLALLRPSRWLVLGLVALFVLDGALAIFHAGVEWRLWEGFTACSGSGLGATSVEDLKAQIMGAPVVRCDEPPFVLLGLSMAGWNAVLALALAAATAWLGLRRPGA
jgi:disulfide bond formation protein DsbB